MRSPQAAFKCVRSDTAAAGFSTATNAVANERGIGKSLSTAAVMMPSVPSRRQEVLQVVAGVVLAQAPESIPHAAVGKHDLEPEHQLARVAVAHHARAAGVGREVAADLAAALRAER
jgi:hypothetical protein